MFKVLQQQNNYIHEIIVTPRLPLMLRHKINQDQSQGMRPS